MTKKTNLPEDFDLFRQTMGKVQAVNTDKVEFHQTQRPKPYPAAKPKDLSEELQDSITFEIDTVSHEESLSFSRPGLQHSALAKLRKGVFRVQAELDLHGLTSHVAKQQLLHFLEISKASGHRCVHVIHGKGHRSTDPQPILKNHLNRWLRQHKDVLAFCSAPQKQGGTGAVFILLKSVAA